MSEKKGWNKSIERLGRAAALAAGVTAGAELGSVRTEYQMPPEVVAQERAYERQQTQLTKEEITAELERCCAFLEKTPPIVSLTIPNNEPNPFGHGGFIEKTLQGTRSNALGNEADLLVAQLSFSSFGGEFRAAMYVPELKALFLDQATDQRLSEKTKNISQYAYRELGKQEGRNWYTIAKEIEGGASLATLPAHTLHEKKDAIVQAMADFRYRQEMKRIKTEGAISHEVFHHFYMQQLEKEGYEGPSVRELLYLALSESQKRFGDQLGSYFMRLNAPELAADIARVTGEELTDDPARLSALCDKLATRYNLTEYAQGDSDDAHLSNELMEVLNEYLSRVFNGLQGYTPEVMQKKFADAAHNIGASPDMIPRELLPWYHDPTPEERATFARMSWHGKPLVSQADY